MPAVGRRIAAVVAVLLTRQFGVAALRTNIDPCVFPPSNFTGVPAVANFSIVTMDALLDCFSSLPYVPAFAAQAMANAHSLLNRFAFTDMVTYTGPPWNKAVDLHAALDTAYASWSNAGNPTDFGFHDFMTGFFNAFNDAHVNYVKPACYRAIYVQPIAVQPVYNNGSVTISAATLQWNGAPLSPLFLSNATLDDIVGQTIVAIDGMDAVSYIVRFAQATLNRATDISGLFNAAVSLDPPQFSIRPVMMNPVPPASAINYTLMRADGTTHIVTLPWMAFVPPSNSTAALSRNCLAPPNTRSANCTALWNDPVKAATCKALDPNATTPFDMISRLAAASITHAALPEDFGTALPPGGVSELDMGRRTPRLPTAATQRKPSRHMPTRVTLRSNTGSGMQAAATDPPDMQLLYSDPEFLVTLQLDLSTKLLHLRIPTFQPPSIAQCWVEMSNSTWCCDTIDVANNTYQCIVSVMHRWVNLTVTSVWDSWNTHGAQGLVLDLTSNGGGTNIFGYAAMIGWIQSFYDDPLQCISRYEMRKDGLWEDMLSFFATQDWVPLPILVYYSSYFFADVGNGSLAPLTPQNASAWYTDWQYHLRGNSSYPFSRALRVTEPEWIRSFVPARPPVTLQPSNFLLVTDGLCGSLCAHVTKALVEHGKVRTLYLGGLPAVDGDCSSFAGGYTMFVTSYGDADAVTVLSQLGFTPSSSTTYLPSLTNQSVSMRYPWPGGLDWNSPEQYLQYSLNKPDAQMYVWGQTTEPEIFLAMAAAAPLLLMMPTLDPSGDSYTSWYPYSYLTEYENYKSIAIGLAVATGIMTVATFGLLFQVHMTARARKTTASSLTTPLMAGSVNATDDPESEQATVGTPERLSDRSRNLITNLYGHMTPGSEEQQADAPQF